MALTHTRAGQNNSRKKPYSNSGYKGGGNSRSRNKRKSNSSNGSYFTNRKKSNNWKPRSVGSRPGYSGRSAFSSRDKRRRGGGRGKPKELDRSLFVNDLQNEVVEEKKNYTGIPYSEFDFSQIIAENLRNKGYQTTTEIQEKAIPLIIDGKDVLGISSTGSGKTGAFLIPMIEKLVNDKSQKLLVVAPTRELAQQIAKEAVSILRGANLNLAVIIGGESMGKQIAQLKKRPQIIVGTPGRLNDLIERGHIRPEQFNNIVIDEVDRMLDMGFIKDIRTIFGKLASKKQSLFFSATLNKTVEKIVVSLSSTYELIRLAENKPSKSVVQSIVNYQEKADKLDKLKEILNRDEVEKAIVFVETKHYADRVDKALYTNNFRVGTIHGNKRQNVRKRVIDQFKRSRINVLVATNVAARGIDIDDITHVINFDEPTSYDEYIHRIGRTGRNGSLGTAYTFVQGRA